MVTNTQCNDAAERASQGRILSETLSQDLFGSQAPLVIDESEGITSDSGEDTSGSKASNDATHGEPAVSLTQEASLERHPVLSPVEESPTSSDSGKSPLSTVSESPDCQDNHGVGPFRTSLRQQRNSHSANAKPNKAGTQVSKSRALKKNGNKPNSSKNNRKNWV